MTYTKKQREAIAEAFKAAKQHLWDGTGPGVGSKTGYICYAIQRGGCPGLKDARKVVEARLGGHLTVWQWLRYQPGVRERQLTSRRVQQHRHAWLDKLIEEFSA